MNQKEVIKLAQFIKDYLNYDEVLNYLKSFKEYVDSQERVVPADLNSKLKEIESKIPVLPAIPDIEPLSVALQKLNTRVDNIKPTTEVKNEITKVVKEEFDASLLIKTLTENIEETKSEIIKLIPKVKEYDKEIDDLYKKLDKIKTAPAPEINSIFRGASRLTQLSDVDTSGVTDGRVLKYNATSKKWEPQEDLAGNPGGLDTHIQYNSSGSFAGSSKFTYNGSNTVTLDGGGLVNTVLNMYGSTNYALISTATDELRFRDKSANKNRLVLSSTGIGVNEAYELPMADGTTGQALLTDGAGNVDWGDVSTTGSTSDFRSDDNKVITVTDGLITAIVESDFTNEFNNEFA